jgi:nucleoid DNA-binding protein
LSRLKLIKQLKKKNPKINLSELETIIETFSISFSEFLKQGNSINIRGLGRWYCKTLKENFNARNPATNELIYKPKRVKIRFKASKKLNKIINE